MPLNAYAESGLDLNRLSGFGFCSNFNVIPKFEIRFYGSEPVVSGPELYRLDIYSRIK